MRASIEIGIATLGKTQSPLHVLIIPGDAVGLDSETVAAVIRAAAKNPRSPVVPTVSGTARASVVHPLGNCDRDPPTSRRSRSECGFTNQRGESAPRTGRES